MPQARQWKIEVDGHAYVIAWLPGGPMLRDLTRANISNPAGLILEDYKIEEIEPMEYRGTGPSR